MYASKMKRFVLRRHEDVSGNSGTGIVAEGCEYSSGMVAITWLSALPVYAWYHSMRVIETLHGHDGRTVVEWIDS